MMVDMEILASSWNHKFLCVQYYLLKHSMLTQPFICSICSWFFWKVNFPSDSVYVSYFARVVCTKGLYATWKNWKTWKSHGIWKSAKKSWKIVKIQRKPGKVMEFAIRSKIKNVQIKWYQVFFSEKRPAAHSPSYSLTFYILHILFKWRGNLTDF
jgi:hypothetical protein